MCGGNGIGAASITTNRTEKLESNIIVPVPAL